MKIIKQGETAAKTVRFECRAFDKMPKEPKITTRARVLECPECHTIFETRRGEYREVYSEHEGTEIHAGCPFCGHRGAKIIKSLEYVISGASDEAK